MIKEIKSTINRSVHMKPPSLSSADEKELLKRPNKRYSPHRARKNQSIQEVAAFVVGRIQ
jgi:hypothetical protein